MSKERKKPAVSFTPSDWRRLRTALDDDPSVEAAVLRVMLATGIRIGDILRVQCSSLGDALRDPDGVVEVIQKGGSRRMLPVSGAPAYWKRLYEACEGRSTVAKAVCPRSKLGAAGGGGAYQRVNRHLRELAAQLQVSGRPHLHRLRRTVATTALKLTKDVHLVSTMLGHRQLGTTSIYLDEVRNDEVAAVQRKLLGG